MPRGRSRSVIWDLIAWCAGRGSKHNLNKTVTRVEALLDSCFNKLGRCFMKPGAKSEFSSLASP